MTPIDVLQKAADLALKLGSGHGTLTFTPLAQTKAACTRKLSLSRWLRLSSSSRQSLKALNRLHDGQRALRAAL
jgi:hypothetical protein